MKHLILHVREHTHGVKEKLRAVSAPHAHHPVTPLLASTHGNVGPVTSLIVLADSLHVAGTATLVVPAGVHHLVEPPFCMAASGGGEARQPHAPPLCLHHVPDLILDMGQKLRVVCGPGFGCVLQMDNAGHFVIVGPGRCGGDVKAQAH